MTIGFKHLPGFILILGAALCQMAMAAEALWIEDLTWVELKARIDAGDTSVILPTGGIEQNGPYIALGKHNLVVAYAAQEIAKSVGHTLIAPVVKVVPQGSMEKPSGNLVYPGTMAVREETFEQVLNDMVLSLAFAGFQRIYLLADHGMSQEPQQKVATKMGQVLAAAHVRVVHLSAFYDPALEAHYLKQRGVPENAQGFHAGVADTAQILAVSPLAVRPLHASKGADNASELGYSGQPDKADARLGRELLQLRVDAAVRQVLGK